jgi:hypothetical protein
VSGLSERSERNKTNEQSETIMILEIFKDPSLGLTNVNELAQTTKLKQKDIKKELMMEESYLLNHRRNKKFPGRFYDLQYPNQLWEIDLVEFPDYVTKENMNLKYLLNCIDGYTKYLWSIPMKRKDSKTVSFFMI